MTTKPNMRSRIDRYEEQGAELASWVEGLSEEQLDKPFKGGETGRWSMRTMVVHMYDSELQGQDRMKRVIAMQGDAHEDAPPESPPVLQAYDETKFAARLPEAIDLGRACEVFRVTRAIMAFRLRSLLPEAFLRTGHHTETGLETLEAIVDGYIEHYDHHARYAAAKRAAM